MWWRRSAWLGAAMLAVFAWACSSSSAPKNPKDTLIVDVDATNIPQQQMPEADAAADSPYGTVEDGNGAYGYSPVGVCKTCACGAGTYCFGGGTGYTTFSGTCTGASGLAVGCQPLPAACASAPTCDCIFEALKPQIGCYPQCEQGKALTVYCMTP